jgi:hypothetical protein
MAPTCLTVLAPIRRGHDAALRDTLREVGDDITGQRRPPAAGRSPIDFVRTRGVHFARFAILDDPDRGPGCVRLLYSSIYDGSIAEHLAELVDVTSNPDAIWGACEGYTGAAAFPSFIASHALEPDAYYAAFRDETVSSVRRAVLDRERTAAVTPASTRGFRDRVIGMLAFVRRAAPIVLDVARAVARFGLRDVLSATRGITASLDRYVVFRSLNWITRNRMPPRRSPFSSVALDNCMAPVPLAPADEIPSTLAAVPAAFREDVITQNQLTLVTVIEDGGADRVRVVMSAIDSYARRLAPPGALLGISTIHFVRWLLIDDGRRLLFLSDYDNSWENYIDEFAEMILSGLDAIWGTAPGFPPDGARDLPAFKRFLRCHQVPSDAFFSAYPDETVLGIAALRARIGRAARS